MTPSKYLSHFTDPKNLITSDRSGDDDLESDGVRGSHEHPDCLAQGCFIVRAIEMPDRDWFVGWYAEIDAHDRPLPSPFQLSEPLVRD